MREEVELPTVEQAEQLRRSIVMLQPRAPALNREQAEHLYAQLITALLEIRRLGVPPASPTRGNTDQHGSDH